MGVANEFTKNLVYIITVLIDPIGNYILVLTYANEGNLREYLKKNFNSLNWNEKIQMASDIASGLKCLHTEGIIHKDLVNQYLLSFMIIVFENTLIL